MGSFITEYIVKLGRLLQPSFFSLGLTPTHLTILSGIAGAVANYELWYNRGNNATIALALYYILDCWDGDYARRYKMVSEFGGQLDSFMAIFGVIYLGILSDKILKLGWSMIFVLIALGIALGTHIYYSCRNISKGSSTATFPQAEFCPGKPKETMEKLKYLELESYTMYLAVITLLAIGNGKSIGES